MLEGLEISILMKSELEFENITKRFDSEFLQKNYLQNIEKIKNYRNGSSKLKEYIVHLSGGATPLGAEYENEGIPFLRVQNIMQNYFNLNDVVYLNKTQDKEIKRSRLKAGDVLLTITGVSYGKSAVVPSELVNANINQHSVKITLNENLNPYFLSTFLNSKHGKLQSDKNIVGVTRPALDYEVIKNFNIPKININIQKVIQDLILNSEKTTKKSETLYKQAETLLLQKIGLQNFKPSKEPVNIKSFKESFGITKRLDAEYYQKKYEQIIDKIKSQKHDSLINIVDISKSIEPGSYNYSDEGGLPFYRVSDFNKFGLSKPDKELTNSFVADNKELIENLKPKQGTILFSKDGSVGTAYLLRKDLDGITSGAILHLQVKNTKEIVPEYLTLALNSKLVQMQAERDAGGSIILHWRKEEIEQVVVPIIDYKKQLEIAELVEESFKLKVESERLLEVAKKAVEMAIEENEAKAMIFLNEQIN